MPGFDPVVFDLDGTVVDTVELIVESFRYATRTVLGEVLPDEVIIAGVGQPLMAQMERALGRARAGALRRLPRVQPPPPRRAHPRLRRRRGGRSTACKAAGRRARHRHQQERATPRQMAFRAVGLREHFDVVVTASDTDRAQAVAGAAAPVPGAARGAAPTARSTSATAPWTSRPARAAGMATAAVAWGVFGREALLAAGPDYWLDEPRELLALCLRGEGRARERAPGRGTTSG